MESRKEMQSLCFLCLVISSYAVPNNADGSEGEECSVLKQSPGGVVVSLPRLDGQDFGFTLEYVFNAPVENVQARSITYGGKPVDIRNVSSTHWIFSVQKIDKIELKKLSVNYTAESEEELVFVTSAILNGTRLCGKDVRSYVYRRQDSIIHSHRKCALKEVLYGNESKLTLEQDFFSTRIGLAIDIFFASDIDKLDQVWSMYATKRTNRSYSFENRGYITSKDRPVSLSFNIHHINRPPPEVAAVLINDVVVCGFAPSAQVVKPPDMRPVLSSIEKRNENVVEAENLMYICLIMSAWALLVSMATGRIAWNVTPSSSKNSAVKEPIYSMPEKK